SGAGADLVGLSAGRPGGPVRRAVQERSRGGEGGMRVALVVPGFPKLSETFIVSKALGLLRRGWDVHVVCGRSEPAEWTHFPELEAAGMRDRVQLTGPVRPAWRLALQVPVEAARLAARPEAWQVVRDGSVPIAERL